MMNKKSKLYWLTFILSPAIVFGVVSVAWAHQPRLIGNVGAVEIKNPDVSQAFYGELKGVPALFYVVLDKPQVFYTGVLVPDLPNIGKDVSAAVFSNVSSARQQVLYGGGNEYLLDGSNFQWTKFYEEFAGDYYWEGPEFKKELAAGDYIIKVFSPNNRGKYVLVVGEKETFPPKEMFKALLVLSKLKKDFFGKSPLTIFSSKIGHYLLILIGVVVAIIVIAFFVFRWKKRKIAGLIQDKI